MSYIMNFLRFWYNFIVGDDWIIAAGVVIALVVSAVFARRDLNAWWVMPVARDAHGALVHFQARYLGLGIGDVDALLPITNP